MESFVSTTISTAIAEFGDKTQLLALLLAAQFKHKNGIVAGIFMSTLLNHLLSAIIGVWAAQFLSADVVKWMVGGCFIIVGLWLALPEKQRNPSHTWLKYGAFSSTAVLFFIAEMGDKTQVVTALLAVQHQELFMVVFGSVIGVMLANVPVIYLGQPLLEKLSAKSIRWAACGVFCVMGIMSLMGYGFAIR